MCDVLKFGLTLHSPPLHTAAQVPRSPSADTCCPYSKSRLLVDLVHIVGHTGYRPSCRCCILPFCLAPAPPSGSLERYLGCSRTYGPTKKIGKNTPLNYANTRIRISVGVPGLCTQETGWVGGGQVKTMIPLLRCGPLLAAKCSYVCAPRAQGDEETVSAFRDIETDIYYAKAHKSTRFGESCDYH